MDHTIPVYEYNTIPYHFLFQIHVTTTTAVALTVVQTASSQRFLILLFLVASAARSSFVLGFETSDTKLARLGVAPSLYPPSNYRLVLPELCRAFNSARGQRRSCDGRALQDWTSLSSVDTGDTAQYHSEPLLLFDKHFHEISALS